MKITLIVSFLIFPIIIFGQVKFNNLNTISKESKELFIGVENHIEVTGIDYTADKRVFNISHGEISSRGGNKYLIRVNLMKPDTLKFYQDDSLYLIEVFSVKTIPQAIAGLAGSSDKLLSISQILNNPVLTVILPSTNYKHNLQIISFDMKILNANNDTISTFTRISGNSLPKKLLIAIKKLSPGNKLLFDNINAACPDYRSLRLSSLLILVE